MLNEKIQDALNEQIKNELYSAYLYLSMSAYLEAQDLSGMAKWMRTHNEEEVEHAMKIFDFVNERGGRVTLGAIDAPPADFESPLALFEEALVHEKKVSAMITDLYELAMEEKDYPTQIMLQWFVTEQVEEEDLFGKVCEMVKRTGGKEWHLLALDNELGKREE